jgi:hypothetical protein
MGKESGTEEGSGKDRKIDGQTDQDKSLRPRLIRVS